MVIRLLPEQIAHRWKLIKYAIANSLPPIAGESHEKMNNILLSLLTGEMQCWVRIEDRIDLIIITKVIEDDSSETKSLLLYCMFGFGTGNKGMWRELYDTLQKYGASRGCDRAIAYTDVPEVEMIWKWLGGQANYKLLSMPIMRRNDVLQEDRD